MYDTLRTDVLVVGGGGAGCRAAIEAHDRGVDVVAIVKGTVGNSGCTVNVGTSASVGPWAVEEDTYESSMRDLLAHGGFLGNQDLVKALAEESNDRMVELQEWGVDFERDANGDIVVTKAAAHSYPRNVTFRPVAPRKHDYGYPPGVAMMDALEDQLRGRRVRVMEEVALVDLLVADGRVVGAVALDYVSNKLFAIHAKATVLATGSFSQVFSRNTVSHFETGDGQAAAFMAGADLIDMEGTQYIASTVGYPPGSVMTNAAGERFLERRGIREAIRTDKETLVYAVWKEIREGRGTERGNIYVDMRAMTDDGSGVFALFEERLARQGTVYDAFEAEPIDLHAGPIETAPIAHTTMGGVRVNPMCEATVPGLYGAGAVVGGVYGHARPEGYTSMITLVFGRRAGLYAAEAAQAAGPVEPSEARARDGVKAAERLVGGDGADPADIKKRLKATMTEHCWVIKDDAGLRAGLEKVRKLEAEAQQFRASVGSEWLNAVEVRSLLITAGMMLEGSIERKDSRGAFFRDDYPETDNENWLRNIIYRQVDGRLDLDTVPVDLKYCGPTPEPAARP